MKKALAFLLMVCCFAIFAACSKKCDHQYQESITADASCKKVGVKTFTCSLCQDSYTEEIPMVAHNFDSGKVTAEATCSSIGTKTFTCEFCGETKSEEIPMAAHNFDSGKVTVAATCSSIGTKTFTCEFCSETKSEEIPMLEHTMDNRVITKEPTCLGDGVESISCSKCGHEITQVLNKIECSYTSEVKKKATCTEDGLKIYTCTTCKATKEEPIKATGHNIVSATCTESKHCEACDFEEGNPLGHTWENVTCTTAKTCSRCGKTEGAALGHSWDEGTVLKEASYTSTGEKAYSCNRCGTQETQYLPMLQSALILPSTPISITDGKDKATITGITYQDDSSDPTPYFTVEILLEKTAGNGYAIFRVEIFDSNGYRVDSATAGIQGEVGTKEKVIRYFYGFPPGVYTLKIVSD